MKENNLQVWGIKQMVDVIHTNTTMDNIIAYNSFIKKECDDERITSTLYEAVLERCQEENAENEEWVYKHAIEGGLFNCSLFTSRFIGVQAVRLDKKSGLLSVVPRQKEVSFIKILQKIPGFYVVESGEDDNGGIMYDVGYYDTTDIRKGLERLYNQLIYYRAFIDCEDGSDIKTILNIEDLNKSYLPPAGQDISLSSLTKQLQALINLLIDKDGLPAKVMSIDTKYLLTVMFARSNHGTALKAVKFERFTNFILDVIARIKLGKKYEIKF